MTHKAHVPSKLAHAIQRRGVGLRVLDDPPRSTEVFITTGGLWFEVDADIRTTLPMDQEGAAAIAAVADAVQDAESERCHGYCIVRVDEVKNAAGVVHAVVAIISSATAGWNAVRARRSVIFDLDDVEDLEAVVEAGWIPGRVTP